MNLTKKRNKKARRKGARQEFGKPPVSEEDQRIKTALWKALESGETDSVRHELSKEGQSNPCDLSKLTELTDRKSPFTSGQAIVLKTALTTLGFIKPSEETVVLKSSTPEENSTKQNDEEAYDQALASFFNKDGSLNDARVQELSLSINFRESCIRKVLTGAQARLRPNEDPNVLHDNILAFAQN